MKRKSTTGWRSGCSSIMEKDGIITADELRLAWINIAGHYEPPFLEVENLDGKIGDGVIVDAR